MLDGNVDGSVLNTVGAVALDNHGNICCARSIGSVTHKRRGQVGNSPIIGSDLYFEKRITGDSKTGHGRSLF